LRTAVRAGLDNPNVKAEDDLLKAVVVTVISDRLTVLAEEIAALC
jgi:hypothetical protein